MSRKSILEPSSQTVWTAGSRLSLRPVQRDEGSDWNERQGFFQHPLGFATVWQGWSNKVDVSWTTIEVIDREGYLHSRQWKRVHPRKTVSRLARLMIEDIV